MKVSTKHHIKVCSRICFFLYLSALFYFLFLAEGYGRNIIVPGYRYNFIPFKEIMRFWIYREQLGTYAVMVNLFGNVAAFFPFGFILPIIGKQKRSLWKVTVLGFLLSLTVELLQLISRVGSCDVDDLILNTLGAFLGYLAFAVCHVWWKRSAINR